MYKEKVQGSALTKMNRGFTVPWFDYLPAIDCMWQLSAAQGNMAFFKPVYRRKNKTGNVAVSWWYNFILHRLLYTFTVTAPV